MRTRIWLVVGLGAPLVCLGLAVLVYYLPPIHERLAWRVANLQAEIKYKLNPPEQEVFLPNEQAAAQIEAIVQATLSAFYAAKTAAAQAVTSTPPAPEGTLTQSVPTAAPPTATPTLVPTPLPDTVELTGIVHEYQNFNNCGPANLSMALSYWGWQGDQNVTRAYLRPSYAIDDKNTNPWEMVDFVQTQTGLQALWRVGGDLELLKRLSAAGFPVIIEKGLQPPKEYWLGHFEIVSGYDESGEYAWVFDSYIGPDRDFPVKFSEIEEFWRHFNNVYVVIYPAERESEVLSILGPDADPQANFQRAAEQSQAETETLSGRDLFFAWFNRGADLVELQDYSGAAQAFDYAYSIVYPTIPEDDRPWRVLWYRSEPYAAYYYTGRYQDVIDLAQTTLTHVDKAVLEETYYWRGMARQALGDQEGAIADLVRAANLNPRSTGALAELQRLGVEP